MRVLVVEDDDGIAAGLAGTLRAAGWAPEVMHTLHSAWTAMSTEPFDLVLLDLGMPDGDGGDWLRRLRASPEGRLPAPHTPVLIMTARDEVASRIRGLDLGADDYVTKPFDAGELAARMRALLRRAAGRAQPLLMRGDISIDPAARTVTRSGVPVELSMREFSILHALVEASPRVLSRAQIEAKLYSWESALDSNAVEVHVHKLRRKLGEDVIRTVRGVGYFVPAERGE